MRRSLNWDQGKEMAGHLNPTRLISLPVYFCHAHSPWQRGSNENMNGPCATTSPGTPTCGDQLLATERTGRRITGR